MTPLEPFYSNTLRPEDPNIPVRRLLEKSLPTKNTGNLSCLSLAYVLVVPAKSISLAEKVKTPKFWIDKA